MMKSQMCTVEQLSSETFDNWRVLMSEPDVLHRKVWEYCYVAQALYERGMMNAGRHGIGFAVGKEPLPALFALYNCLVTATDLYTNDAEAWSETGQHASSFESLRLGSICSREQMEMFVTFEFVDMRAIPFRYENKFDFVWSACALEHLGSLDLGLQFIMDSLQCLRPGGVAVHTTEFNLSSDTDTLESGPVVLYRKSDLNRLRNQLWRNGWRMDLDFTRGDAPEDHLVSIPPTYPLPHIHLKLGDYITTSFGLIITERIDAASA